MRAIHRVLVVGLMGIGLAGGMARVRGDEPRAMPPGIVATFKGHTEAIYAIAFSPDGKFVLTGSFDKTLKLWDATTGKEIRTFGGQAGHQNLVLAAAFSPDGRSFASGGSDNAAKIWDVPVNLAVRDFVHADAVQALALSPDGTRLAGAGKDGSIKLWNTADGKQLFNLVGHTGPVTGVAFSGNGQILASSGTDRTVRVWNPGNGQAVATIGAHATPVASVVVAPGGNLIYSAGDDGLLKFWNQPVAPQRLLPPQPEAVTCMLLSADGGWIVAGGADKAVRISNFDNGQLVRPFGGLTAAPTALGLTNNRAYLATGTADGRLFLWNTGDGRLLSQTAVHSGPVTAIAFPPANDHVLTGGKDGQIKLWQLVPNKQTNLPEPRLVKVFAGHRDGVASLAYHANGTQVLSAGGDGLLKLWDLPNVKLIHNLGPVVPAWTALGFGLWDLSQARPVRIVTNLGAPVREAVFSRDFNQVAAAGGKLAKVWNFVDGKEVASLPHAGEVATVSISPDKTRIVTGAADQEARVWDAATSKELEFFARGGAVKSVVYHPNNTAIVVGGAEKVIAVHTAAINRGVVASAQPIRQLAIPPSGSHVLTAGDDKQVTLWNAGNGAKERVLSGATAPLTAVAVSRNQVVVAAAASDGTIRLYQWADGKELGQVKAPAAVRALNFSPNNQLLAASCANHAVASWNVLFNPGQPIPPEFGKASQTFTHAGAATDVAFAPDSVTLYSSGLDKAIKAWKFAAETPTKNFGHANLVDAVAFNPASTLLATGSHDGTVRIWDVAKGQQVRQIDAHTKPAVAPVYCVAWTPDGKQILSCSLDRTMKLWDANSGGLVREFKAYKEKEFEKGHRDGVFCAAFSPDGQFIASGSSDYTIKIWKVADASVVRDCVNPTLKAEAGATPAPPRAHPGWVYSLRYSADGKLLISTGNAPRNQGYLAVWNAGDGRLLHGETLTLGPMYSVAVSPDAQLLALAGAPRGRQFQEVNAYLLKMPPLEKRQLSQATR